MNSYPCKNKGDFLKDTVEDIRIDDIKEVLPPITLHEEMPVSNAAAALIKTTRHDIHNILHGIDDRLMVVIGPCSIHDPAAAIEYAKLLKAKKDKLGEYLLLIMRVYFEKPRTTIGWKGLINDPDLDGSFSINKGLRTSRNLLLEINELGVPCGSEFLDLITPQYIADLVSWGAIGARTTESQVHRELASGLSCPVGFKNGTDGDLKIAIDAVCAAARPHIFLSMTKFGKSAIFATTGNRDGHIILRGGKNTNYDSVSVCEAKNALIKARVKPKLMIDFSHGNSNKKYLRQIAVCNDVVKQIENSGDHIAGVMIESNLVAGNQDVNCRKSLTYGQSITDACLSWEQSIGLLDKLAEAVALRRNNMRAASTVTEQKRAI